VPRALEPEIAKRAKSKGIETVVYDRGGYNYHGRRQSLAEAAREAGLNFRRRPPCFRTRRDGWYTTT
jgi:hypothetical protein